MKAQSYFDECIKKNGFCFIAEISNNHLVDFDRYLKLIDSAVDQGVHAVKIQTYSPSSLLSPFRKKDIVKEGPWKGQTYWDLYSSICAPLDWTPKIFEYARSRGIFIFSSPFSREDVDILESVGCPAYKIASFEFNDVTLWDAISACNKPILASTGISDEKDVQRILSVQDYSSLIDTLFSCSSSYPSRLCDLRLHMPVKLNQLSINHGLSDHSLDHSSVVYSFSQGVRVFEKHITLNRQDGGPDSFFSLEPSEVFRHMTVLKDLVDIQNYNSKHASLSSDRKGLSYGRCVYANKSIQIGEIIDAASVSNFRPYNSNALPAFRIQDLYGKASKHLYNPGDYILASELS